MAARVRARAPWNDRVNQFRDWEPAGNICIGVIIAQFYHLWLEAEGGGVTNYASADRLSEYLPLDWSQWSRTLLDRMSVEDEDFGLALLDFPGFIHILLTRWIYPPGHQHEFDLGDGIQHLAAPPPQGNPAPPGRAPSSPPVPPHTPPHVEPLPRPTQGMFLAPPSPHDRHTPPLPLSPYRRTARISAITSLGETFRFTIPDQVSAEFLGEPSYGSNSGETSSEDTSSTSGDTSGSEETWFTGSDDSDDNDDDVPSPEMYHLA